MDCTHPCDKVAPVFDWCQATSNIHDGKLDTFFGRGRVGSHPTCVVKEDAKTVVQRNQREWRGVGKNGITITNGGHKGTEPVISFNTSLIPEIPDIPTPRTNDEICALAETKIPKWEGVSGDGIIVQNAGTYGEMPTISLADTDGVVLPSLCELASEIATSPILGTGLVSLDSPDGCFRYSPLDVREPCERPARLMGILADRTPALFYDDYIEPQLFYASAEIEEVDIESEDDFDAEGYTLLQKSPIVIDICNQSQCRRMYYMLSAETGRTRFEIQSGDRTQVRKWAYLNTPQGDFNGVVSGVTHDGNGYGYYAYAGDHHTEFGFVEPGQCATVSLSIAVEMQDFGAATQVDCGRTTLQAIGWYS